MQLSNLPLATPLIPQTLNCSRGIAAQYIYHDRKLLATLYSLALVKFIYSHLSNKLGGWNKCGGGAKFAKSLNVEVGINEEGGILWKKLMHNSNK